MKSSTLIALSVSIAIIFIGSALLLGGRATSNSTNNADAESATTIVTGTTQTAQINVRGGYSPREIVAKADTPLTLTMHTQNTFDCSASVSIPAISYRANLPNTGDTPIQIPAQKAGTTIRGTCGMGMYNFSVRFE
jgi:plastocyanin domain-containing protein